VSEQVIRTMLAAAGLAASDEEIEAFAAAYPDYRAGADALYAVPAARYVDPALRFQAASRIEDWA
jgi:hypothetical protein